MKKILAFLLTFLLAFPVVSMAAGEDGVSFSADFMYTTETSIKELPATVEVVLNLPATQTARAGNVLGDYSGSGKCFNIEIHQNGTPRFYYTGSGALLDKKFTSVNVSTGEWVHLAVVADSAAGQLLCYVNGELKQTISDVTISSFVSSGRNFCIGGDHRSGNSQSFKGRIKSVRLYNDVRTASEIASDYAGTTLDKSGLMLAYDLAEKSDGSNPSMLEDLSGNGMNAYCPGYHWPEENITVPTDYAYSMAVIGDSNIANSTYPDAYNNIYSWLIKNADVNKTEFVFSLGDMTDNNYYCFALADANFMNLNERIPFSFVRGEKDSVSRFNEVFTLRRYSDEISGSFDNTMLNTYRKFEAGNMKYLALSLDIGASDDVIAWANRICAENPDRNIIVNTHAYMDVSGDLIASDASLGTNIGANLWDKLIKLHENISLVLCGHSDTRNIVKSQKTGDNGNTVTQLLINSAPVDTLAGGAGMVAMLYFSEDGSNVDLRYYSPMLDSYFMIDNQFSFTLDAVTSQSSSPAITLVPVKIYADGNLSDKISTKNKYSFTVGTDDGIEVTENKISLQVNLERAEGTVFAALYDKENSLEQIKTYSAKRSFDVEFDNVSEGDTVKIMWWSSDDAITPYSVDKSTKIEIG